MSNLVCKECGFEGKTQTGLYTHIRRKHDQAPKEYYDKHIKTEQEGLCVICSNQTEFRTKPTRYLDVCGLRCRGVLVNKNWAPASRAKNIEMMQGNTISKGRPKGSKNKNAYPMTDKVLEKLRNNPPPSWANKNHKPATIIKMSIARNKYIEINGMDWMTPHSGRFIPINPSKYMGDVKNIIYRSSWESAFFRRCDTDPNIIAWGSEEIVIPYHDRASGKLRRYFPDVIIKKRGPDGSIKIILIEIKPYSQSVPPERGTKSERRYLNECKTFATNYSKWEAATRFAKSKGWEFMVLTEKQLGIGR